MNVNRGRVFLGGFGGSLVWAIWSWAIGHFMIGMARYEAAQSSGLFLRTSRYPFFAGQWVAALFVMSVILTYVYASARGTLGAGPFTALKIGVLVGYIAGFPLNFAQATWVPIDRVFPLGWMLDMWGGCVLAALVGGWLYKD